MSIKKLISKALSLAIAVTMLSIATPNFVNDIPATVHAETQVMGTAYKWDTNGNKTIWDYHVQGTSWVFTDCVFATIDDLSYDSISVDKSSKTVTVKNLKCTGTGQIAFGGIPGWTYVFDCNYSGLDDKSNYFYLICQGDCTVKMPEGCTFRGIFTMGVNQEGHISLDNTLADLPYLGLSTTSGFNAMNIAVVFSHKSAVGTEETVNNLTYEIQSTDTVAFSGTVDKSGTITIPEEVEINGKTYKVTTISKGAFDGNASLKTMVIPSSVTKIEKYACADCKNLGSISTNADTLKTIDKHAFDSIKKKAKFKITAKKKSTYNKMIKKLKKSTDVKNIKTQMVKSKK